MLRFVDECNTKLQKRIFDALDESLDFIMRKFTAIIIRKEPIIIEEKEKSSLLDDYEEEKLAPNFSNEDTSRDVPMTEEEDEYSAWDQHATDENEYVVNIRMQTTQEMI